MIVSGTLCTIQQELRSYTSGAANSGGTTYNMARKTMRNLRVIVRNAAIITAFSVSLSACVVYPARGYYIGGPVAVAPPPVQVETYGVAPAPGYFWIGGYWGWEGGRHVWHGGRWEAPRAGYRWEPHRWVHERDGWHLSGGHWARR